MPNKGLRLAWYCGRNVFTSSRTWTANSKTIICPNRHLTSVNPIRKDEVKPGSTIDQQDVQKFSLLKDWWNPNGSMKALHSMNLIRVPFIRDGLVPPSCEPRSCLPLKNKMILDVGCGGGILSEGLARLGANATGVDANKDLIELAIEHRNVDPRITDYKPEYHHTTIEEHVANNSSKYDAVVASEVIEHVNNKELFVKSCIQAVKPGGRLFFTSPTRTTMSRIFTVFVAEYVLKLVPAGTHDFNKFMTPNELTFLLERNGCHVEVVYGVFYHFLANRWEFVKSQQLMFALQAVKLK